MTHEAQAMAPVVMRAPVQAQDMSEYMSLGVMVSWQRSGLVPRGMRKPSWLRGERISFSLSSYSNQEEEGGGEKKTEHTCNKIIAIHNPKL